MLKEAINRILELSAPNVMEHEGRKFTDKRMTPLPDMRDSIAEKLKVNTLTSILDYISQDVDRNPRIKRGESRYIIHIEDYDTVHLYCELDRLKQREELLEARICNNRFRFGSYMNTEDFIINMQADFIADQNRDELLKLVGNMKSGTEVNRADDGMTQQVTAKTGITLVQKVNVKNPITLRAYRTFTEVEQPQGTFVFRLREQQDKEVLAALFEADGDAWKRTAIQTIKEWFQEHITGELQRRVVILA